MACATILHISIDRLDYWNELTSLWFGQHLVLHRPDMQYKYQPYELGLADCAVPGYEYDLRPYMEADTALYDPGMIPPRNVYDATMAGGTIETGTFAHVIGISVSDIHWKTREWIGLAMLLSTVILVSSLTLIATWLQDRKQKQLLWGATFTEEGVNDMLQVG